MRSYELNSQAWTVFSALQKVAPKYSIPAERIKGARCLGFKGQELPDEIALLVLKTQLSNLVQLSLSALGNFKQLRLKVLPSVPPAILTLGSQLPGWSLHHRHGRGRNKTSFDAIATGPARCMSQEPKKLFQQLRYHEKDQKKAVIVLETDSDTIPEDIVVQLAKKCNVIPKNLAIIHTASNTNVGAMLGGARAVEMAIYRAVQIGFPPYCFVKASSTALVVPTEQAKTQVEATAMIIDAIAYGSEVELEVSGLSDELIESKISSLVSQNSPNYGSLMVTNLKSADDAKEVDVDLMVPAVLSVHNINTGKDHYKGKYSFELLEDYYSHRIQQ